MEKSLTGKNVIQRWQARVERGLAGLVEKAAGTTELERYSEALKQSRSLKSLNAPLSRLLNTLGEIGLRLGFSLLSLILLKKGETLDPQDPLLKINLSRARLGLANRFLLRAPESGAAAYNLTDGKKRLEALLGKNILPDSRSVEAGLLLRRIEDRLEMWGDFKRGELESEAIREFLRQENKKYQRIRSAKIATEMELEKFSGGKTGFYYREYRQEQEKKREKRRRHGG